MGKNILRYYLGIDIGGTKCAVVVGDDELNIHRRVQFDTLTTERSWQEIINEFFDHIDELFSEFPREGLSGIGISCGGPLDSFKGMIYSPPNLPGWDSVPIVDIFNEKYKVPVSIQNDANASALAEWLLGAGKGTRNMIFLTFGTGMGAGLILNGRLYAGTNDLAGEVGHIRLAKDGPIGFGKAGSFEVFCSGGGIAQLAKKVDILNPECIVIGSIYARNENLFKPVIDRILVEETIPSALEMCEIKPALLGDSIGDYAALCVALYKEKF